MLLMRQISAFIENRPGRMAEVMSTLADEGINIHALSLADTSDFGILRVIVSDPDRAMEILKANGLMARVTEVVAIAVAHAPGSLARVLREMSALGISIEYMYAFASRSKDHDAMVILRLDNQEASLDKLEECDVQILGPELLERLNAD